MNIELSYLLDNHYSKEYIVYEYVFTYNIVIAYVALM